MTTQRQTPVIVNTASHEMRVGEAPVYGRCHTCQSSTKESIWTKPIPFTLDSCEDNGGVY